MPDPRPLGTNAANIVNRNVEYDASDVDTFLEIHHLAALAGNEDIMRLCREGINRNIVAVRSQEKLLGERLDKADDLIMSYERQRKEARGGERGR